MAILDLISQVHLPSSVNMLPKYLKHFTFSSCFWSIVIVTGDNDRQCALKRSTRYSRCLKGICYIFSTIIDKTSKNNAKNKTNNENAPTFHYYLEQNYVHPPPSLVIKTFSTKEIASIIKALKTKNSHGFDEICIKLLKISATYKRSQLTYICNKSILSGISPDCMKFSIIKPVYKKGNKMNPTNCGPISLLTSFLKVFK